MDHIGIQKHFSIPETKVVSSKTTTAPFGSLVSEQKSKIYSVIERIPLKTSAQHNAEFKLVNTFGGFAESRPSHMFIQNNEKDNTKYY